MNISVEKFLDCAFVKQTTLKAGSRDTLNVISIIQMAMICLGIIASSFIFQEH